MKDSDSSEMGNKWGDPYVCSAYCLERVSRTYYEERESGRSRKTPWVEEREWRIWGTLRQPVFARQSKTAAAAAAAKSFQSCPILCNPIDGSPPGSPLPGILQARTLEWVAMSLSNAWKWKVKVKSLSHVQLLATAWTAAHQAPPSMGFSRQEQDYIHIYMYITSETFRESSQVLMCSHVKKLLKAKELITKKD